jgi:hypothetical protein
VKRIFFAVVLFGFLLACGRGEVVFSPEITSPAPTFTPTPTSTPRLEPTPSPAPTPNPWEEWEKVFFPVLEELRRVPGNENAVVAWQERDRRFKSSADYPLRGVSVIPKGLLAKIDCWEDKPVFVAFVPPRQVLSTDPRLGFSPVRCTEDSIIIDDPQRGIIISFIIYSPWGKWLPVIPQWEGPDPP